MTTNLPFTPSVIAYDPPRKYVLGVIPAPGSVLDIVENDFKQIAALIIRANQQKIYTTTSPVTIFVSASFVYDPNILISEAVQMCRSVTVPRRLDRMALKYSAEFTLRTLATPFDILIQNIGDVTIVNNRPVVRTIDCTNGVIHVVA